MTKLKQDKQEKHLWRLKDLLKLLNYEVFLFLEILKARRIKFHKYENNLPNKKNLHFSNFELEKWIALTLFLPLLLLYGFKMSIIFACIF